MVYERKLLFSVCGLETVGQPYLREVAQELIVTIISTNPRKAINLFFMSGYFFDLTLKTEF
jgi:hypothetical protein